MKREKLREMGLSDEQVDLIMTEHGKAVKDLTANVEQLKGEKKAIEDNLTAASGTIEQLKKDNSDNEELQKQIEAYKTEVDTLKQQQLAERKEAYITLELSKANPRNEKAVRALLDIDAITEKDGTYNGISEQIEALRESDAYLFADKPLNEPSKQAVVGGNPSGTVGTVLSAEEQAMFDAFDKG